MRYAEVRSHCIDCSVFKGAIGAKDIKKSLRNIDWMISSIVWSRRAQLRNVWLDWQRTNVEQG